MRELEDILRQLGELDGRRRVEDSVTEVAKFQITDERVQNLMLKAFDEIISSSNTREKAYGIEQLYDAIRASRDDRFDEFDWSECMLAPAKSESTAEFHVVVYRAVRTPIAVVSAVDNPEGFSRIMSAMKREFKSDEICTQHLWLTIGALVPALDHRRPMSFQPFLRGCHIYAAD